MHPRLTIIVILLASLYSPRAALASPACTSTVNLREHLKAVEKRFEFTRKTPSDVPVMCTWFEKAEGRYLTEQTKFLLEHSHRLSTENQCKTDPASPKKCLMQLDASGRARILAGHLIRLNKAFANACTAYSKSSNEDLKSAFDELNDVFKNSILYVNIEAYLEALGCYNGQGIPKPTPSPKPIPKPKLKSGVTLE